MAVVSYRFVTGLALAASLMPVPVAGDGSPALMPAATADLVLLDGRRIADAGAGFAEPSDLALAADGETFWAVSDNSGKVFSISKTGKLRLGDTIDTGVPGLEGVAADPARGRILAVSEDRECIIELMTATGAQRNMTLTSIAGYDKLDGVFETSHPNNGLEGITVDPADGTVYLLIEVTPDLGMILGARELTAEHGFMSDAAKDRDLDMSALGWDPVRNGIWIASDTGSAVYFYDPVADRARGWALRSRSGRVQHADGVASSADGRSLLIVTDDRASSRLFTYSFH